jgi:hypothetical protein
VGSKLPGVLLSLGLVAIASCATGSASTDDAPLPQGDGGHGGSKGSQGSTTASTGASSGGSTASSTHSASSSGGATSVTSSTATGVPVTSSGMVSSAASGLMCMPPPGPCDDFTCALGCFGCIQFGCCINSACVCQMTPCPDMTTSTATTATGTGGATATATGTGGSGGGGGGGSGGV